jgi:hypothetical protein
MRQFAFISIIAVLGGWAPSVSAAEVETVAGMRPGYLVSTEQEHNVRVSEMVYLPTPAPRPAVLMGRPLLNDKLKVEFREKYAAEFGRTEAERNYNGLNRYTFFDDPGGRQETAIAYNERQRKFGNYMLRRLVEHHVDEYAKNNSDIRPIYELKDRIANLDVKVRKDYKIKFHYNYSGNSLEAKLDNPYDIEAKLTLQMGQTVGPSKVESTTAMLSYPVSKKLTLAAFEEFDQQAATVLVASRALTKSLSSSVTLAANKLVDRDNGFNSQRHQLVLVGFSWTE